MAVFPGALCCRVARSSCRPGLLPRRRLHCFGQRRAEKLFDVRSRGCSKLLGGGWSWTAASFLANATRGTNMDTLKSSTVGASPAVAPSENGDLFYRQLLTSLLAFR